MGAERGAGGRGAGGERRAEVDPEMGLNAERLFYRSRSAHMLFLVVRL